MKLMLALLLLSCRVSAAGPSLDGRMVDLTHAIDEKHPYWPTDKLAVLGELHGGTLFETAKTRNKTAKGVDEIPLEKLIVKFVLIDVSRWASKNRNYQARVSDFADWEKYHERIPEKSVVLVRTGYSKNWGDREKYLGTHKTGRDAVDALRFPGLHQAAVDWLIKRGVSGVGIDTASVDHGFSKDFEAHKAFAKAGVFLLENLDDLGELPETGGTLMIIPHKLKGAAIAPARVLAFLEK